MGKDRHGGRPLSSFHFKSCHPGRRAGWQTPTLGDSLGLERRICGVAAHVAGGAPALPSWTLNPTALLHEALIKIHSWPKLPVSDDPHFMALTARAMRQLLVDEVRKKAQSKRGGGVKFVPLTDGAQETSLSPAEFLDLNRALDELAEMNARHAMAIEYTVFFGYTTEEAAALLHISAKTVERDLRAANAWLAGKVKAGTRETAKSETNHTQRAVK